MRKKSLKTIEEVLALKDTDTKIYTTGLKGYHQFVQGTLCYFDDGGSVTLREFGIGEGFANKYIIIEEEATKEDIGKLCKFWNDDPNPYAIGIFSKVSEEENDNYPYRMDCIEGLWYKHCRRLTSSELAEITGYKVEEL